MPHDRVERARGYEINEKITAVARDLWSAEGLNVHHRDFTAIASPYPDERFNLVICNLPYVRHHYIGG